MLFRAPLWENQTFIETDMSENKSTSTVIIGVVALVAVVVVFFLGKSSDKGNQPADNPKPKPKNEQANPQNEQAKPAEPKEPTFINQGLVAYYPFNGNAKDASGQGRDGIATMVEYVDGGFGADGKAGKFAGSGSRITVDAKDFPSGKAPRTLSCFVKVTGAISGTENFWLGYGSDSFNRSFCLFADGFDAQPIPNGMFAWSQWGKGVGFTKENEAKLNQWYMLTATYDGKTAKTYLDGKFVDSKDFALDTDTSKFFIGQRDFRRYTIGLIDEVRVWDRALTSDQVYALFEWSKR